MSKVPQYLGKYFKPHFPLIQVHSQSDVPVHSEPLNQVRPEGVVFVRLMLSQL